MCRNRDWCALTEQLYLSLLVHSSLLVVIGHNVKQRPRDARNGRQLPLPPHVLRQRHHLR